MVGVETVSQAEHELQLGTKFEIRQIEVAAHTRLEEDIVALKLEDIVVSPTKVNDRAQACHEIRPMVTSTLRGVDDVGRTRDIDSLEILSAASQTVRSLRIIVVEGHMSAAKIESGGKAE
jgi:hypothetical protein